MRAQLARVVDCMGQASAKVSQYLVKFLTYTSGVGLTEGADFTLEAIEHRSNTHLEVPPQLSTWHNKTRKEAIIRQPPWQYGRVRAVMRA
jgi:hypothetical protein